MSPADRTARVLGWQPIDDVTVRVQVSGAVDLEPGDSSDGIPTPVELETSRTVAVTVVDLDEAMDVLVSIARRDRVPLSTLRLRVDERTPADQFRAIGLCISDWWRFKNWLPRVIRDVELQLFRRYDQRKAQAIVFRLRLLVAVVADENPPQNYTVLRLE